MLGLYYDNDSDTYISPVTKVLATISKFVMPISEHSHLGTKRCEECGCLLSRFNAMAVCRNCVEKVPFASVEKYLDGFVTVYTCY